MRLITVFFLLLVVGLKAQPKDIFTPNDLKIEWQLVTNNYKGEDKHLSSWRLTNESKKTTLPSKGWVIYYNATRDVVKKDIGEGLETYRIHGDLFCLKPTAQFKGLKPNESIQMECIGDAWVFNKSDAPIGFYWVWDATPSVSHAITKVTTRPPADLSQFKRSPNQKNDQITPERVYEQNKTISDIPESQLPKVFPTPVSYTPKEGRFILFGTMERVYDAQITKEKLNIDVSLFTDFFKTNAPVNLEKKGTIYFNMDKTLPNEAYNIQITPQRMDISASSVVGFFYAMQTLKSMLPLETWKSKQDTVSLPCVEIRDYPRFEYRGLHIDVARNFQTKEQVKKVLDFMGLYKLNKLHFHFSEDEAWRIEIPALPELTSIGSKRGHTLDSKTHLPATYGSGGDIKNPQSAFYTRQDYIDILKYAKDRFISVIPEIETPGHARAAIKAMNARYARLMQEGKTQEAQEHLLADPNDKSVYNSAQNFGDNVMCVALPSVYKFIETTVDALIDMHKEAGMPLTTIHMGGDEVPAGVWEKSPLCQDLLKQLPRNEYKQTSDLWIYYWRKVSEIIKKRGLYVSGWEEIGMRESKIEGNKVMMINPVFANDNFHTYVWNTVMGWGSEDLPYRLANGGYKVVLCPVSNLYFDLAYQKDFDEPGYYWGGFVDIDKPFYFIPFNYLKNTKVDRFGNPIDPSVLVGKDRLTDYGKSNIVGIQGHLWSENIRSAADLEYLGFPKILGLVERAWAADPDWAKATDPQKSEELYQKAWSQFVNTVGKRELVKLNYYQGGVQFRIPTAGAKLEKGTVLANIQFPGLDIRYTTDGSEPHLKSPLYTQPISAKGTIKLRAFDSKGRGGRTIQVENK